MHICFIFELYFLCKGETSVDVCLLHRDSGPCGDAISQWYFDTANNQCKLFTYGGCRGNGIYTLIILDYMKRIVGNRYATKSQCEQQCLKDQTLSALTVFDDGLLSSIIRLKPHLFSSHMLEAVRRWTVSCCD